MEGSFCYMLTVPFRSMPVGTAETPEHCRARYFMWHPRCTSGGHFPNILEALLIENQFEQTIVMS